MYIMAYRGNMWSFKPVARRGKRGFNRNRRRRAVLRRRRRITPLIQPSSKMVRLRFADNFQLNATAGNTVARELIRCNSMYDPENSLGGAQPNGYDEWMNFYTHYTVLGARIKAVFQSIGTTGNAYNVCGIGLIPTTTTDSSFKDMMGDKYIKWRPIGSADGGNAVTTVTNWFSAKKYFGVKDVKDNTDRIGATDGANPTEQAYFDVFVAGGAGVTDATAVNVYLTVEYIALLTEPVDLERS